MRARIESTRPVFGRVGLAIATLVLVCIAPSAWATATGTLTKTFDTNATQTVALGGETLMQITVSIAYSAGNTNIFDITDNLPAGMVVAPEADQPQPPSPRSTCPTGVAGLTATPGSSSVTFHLYSSTTRLGYSCFLRVKLKAVQPGVWTNTASATTGSDQPGGGPGITVTGSATLTVIGPPVLARGITGFQPGTTDGTLWAIPGNPLTLHYTLSNPNAALTQTGVGFTENFPSGLGSLAGIINNTCSDSSGSLNTATVSASGIVMSGVQLAAGASCGLDVGVSANNAGSYTLGAIVPTSNENGAGAAVAAVTFLAFTQPHSWMVTNPVTAVIPLDGSGTMTLALESTSTVDVAGVDFSATLPSGLAVADSTTMQCGGTATASAATGKLTLTGATVPANGTCNVNFTVTGTQVGDQYADSVVTVHGAPSHSDFGAYFTVEPLATTTTLSATPAPVHGQNVTFTAAVSLPAGSSRAAVGTVAFTENGNPLPGGCASAATVSGGLATCATSTLSVATHHVVATFTPSDGNTKTSAGSADVIVGRAEQAALSLTATPNVLIPGMTSQLAASGGTGGGAITYAVDSGPCSVSGSVATATGVGSCVVRATKASDTNYNAASTTATITVQAANLPVAQLQSVNVNFNTAQAIQLVGSDDNIGGPYALTYAIASAPVHGTISGLNASTGALTYTPAADSAGGDSFSFTVSSTNGVSQAAWVIITTTVPHLTLAIQDGRDFARYGEFVDYNVTLSNGTDVANAIPVQFRLSEGFDAQGATFACPATSDGASCSQDAADPLSFTITLPPGHSMTWLVGAPVRSDTTDDFVTLDVFAVGADVVSDTRTLVIFRDDFDATASGSMPARVVDGESARAVLEGASGEATTVPVVPDNAANALPLATWLIVHDAAREARVEARFVADTWLVRLRAREADGHEHASAWSVAESGAVLTLGSVSDGNDQRVLLLEGAREPLALH